MRLNCRDGLFYITVGIKSDYRKKVIYVEPHSKKNPELLAWTNLPQKILWHNISLKISHESGLFLCQQDGGWGKELLSCFKIVLYVKGWSQLTLCPWTPQSFPPTLWSHKGRFSYLSFFKLVLVLGCFYIEGVEYGWSSWMYLQDDKLFILPVPFVKRPQSFLCWQFYYSLLDSTPKFC